MTEIPLIKKTIIDCDTWLRRPNAGSLPSELLTRYGTRCCLGFAAQQSGVEDRYMKEMGVPTALVSNYDIKINELIDDEIGEDSQWAARAMIINDDESTTDRQKMNLLTRHWKKLGKDYSVEFINVPVKQKKSVPETQKAELVSV